MGVLKSGSEGEKESHTIMAGNFKQQEDLEMYGQYRIMPNFRGMIWELIQI